MALVELPESDVVTPAVGGGLVEIPEEKPEEQRGLLGRATDYVRGLFREEEPKVRGAGVMWETATPEEKAQALARERSPVFLRPAEARAVEGPEASLGSVASDIAAQPAAGLRQIRAGIRTAAGDIMGSEYLRRQGLREAARVGTEQAASEPQFESETAQGLYRGVRSLAQQAPGLALGIVGRAASIPLAQAGAVTSGEAYARYRERGASPTQSAIGALGEGAVEVLTELAPMGTLVNQFGRAGAARFVAELLVKDVPGEQAATIAQDAIDTAIANPDKTWADYFAERPSAAWQTLLATFGQAGVVGAAHAGARAVGRRGAPREAVDVGKDAARLAAAVGKKSRIDLTQLSAVTDEQGNVIFETPSGARITKEQWDNAGRRMREAWLTTTERGVEHETLPGQAVPEVRTAERPGQPSVLQSLPRRVYAELEAMSPDELGATAKGQLQELRRRVQEEGQTEAAALRAVFGADYADAPSELRPAIERALDVRGVPSRDAQGIETAEVIPDEELTAAPPPKSDRVQELERLALEAETPEARKELERQAKAQAKKEEDEFRKFSEADDLMRLASKTEDAELAADLRARALKLRGAEPKPEAEKPAVRGLRVREEAVEEIEARPVEEPSAEQDQGQIAEEARALGIETEGRKPEEVRAALIDALDSDWTQRHPEMDIDRASLVRRAADLDEQAVHDAAVRHGDDEQGFLRSVQEIIDAKQEREAARRGARAEPAPGAPAGRPAAGEGKPPSAGPAVGRQTTVWGEQGVRPAEPGERAKAKQERAGPERGEAARDVKHKATEARAAEVLKDVTDSLRSRLDETDQARYSASIVEQPKTPQHRVAKAVAKAIFNTDVHWFTQTGKALTAGFKTGRMPNAIFLEAQHTPYPAMAVTGHELLHEMRSQQPEVYNALVGSLLPVLKDIDIHRRRLGVHAMYQRGGGEGPTQDRALEELVADIVGDRFTEPEFWSEVARLNPGRFDRIAGAVLKFIDNVIAMVTNRRPFGTERYLTDLKAARTAVAKAVDDYHKSIATERDLQASVGEQQTRFAPAQRVTQADLEAAGADAKKMQEHRGRVDEAVKSFLGERAFTWMESNGLLRPMWSWEDEGPSSRDREIPAFTADREGRAQAVFYYDRIEDVARVPELLVHEIGVHFGLRRMLGEKEYKKLLDQVVSLKKDADPVFVESWRAVKRDYIDERARPFFDEGSEAFLEEVAAAVVQTYPKDPFVKRLLAQVRAWVHQNISPRLAGKMDETLMKGLAMAALRRSGRGEFSTEALPGLRRSTVPGDDSVAQIMMARPGRTPPPKSVATTHASVVEKWLDYFNRHWLDSFSQLKKRQLQKVPGQLRDQLNAFAREQLMHGRAKKRLENINIDYLGPIIKMAGEAELTREDVSDGLYAMHAPEANAYIASNNPAKPDGGSGMTNKASQQILASYTPEQRQALGKIMSVIQKMNRAKLDRMVDDGLITPQQRADMQARYKYWLSLRQMSDEETFGLGGPGFSVKGREFKVRTGRYSQAEDPLSMTIRDAMYAVMRAEKNRVAQTFYNFVLEHPDPTLWEEVTAANYPVHPIKDEATGQVSLVPNPYALYRDKEFFGVKIGGEQKWIRIKDPLLAEQLKKLGDHGLESDNELWHSVIRGINFCTRLLSRLYTQLSVDFMFTNPLRDVQQGIVVATSFDKKKGKELAMRMFKNLPAGLRDAAVASFKEMMGKHPGGLYEQFKMDGGTTGGFGLDDARTIQKQMEYAIAALNGDKKAKAMITAQALLKPVAALNDSFENMTRFAVYKAALEIKDANGKPMFSREQAAVMAKNVTVNFDKRGMASPLANALWAFFNASIQGSVVFIRAVSRARIPQLAAAGLLAAGAYAAFADDEDEHGVDESERTSEFVLDRNLFFPFGDKKGVKFPLSYGFNIPYATGRHFVRVLQGKESIGHMLGAILKLGFTTFLPTDSPVPTLTQPIFDVVTGEDFAGRRIAKEDPFDHVTPKSSQYRDNANAAAVAFFKALNAATWGSEFTKGAIDVSPEKATYLIKQYLGGLAAPLELIALPFAEKVTIADVPVARRFVTEAKEDIYITKAARIIREAKARRKALVAARNRILKENKEADVSDIDEELNLIADQMLTARKAQEAW
jgi:hypothetical protein